MQNIVKLKVNSIFKRRLMQLHNWCSTDVVQMLTLIKEYQSFDINITNLTSVIPIEY